MPMYRPASSSMCSTAPSSVSAVEHIDELAGRYMGVDEYPNHGEESGARVMLEIRPDHVVAHEQ